MEKEKNVIQSGGANDKKDVILFKAEWCGHCVGFKTHWNKLKKDHKKEYNFITYDVDENKKEMESWGIQGFPTIIVKKGDDAMEYVGPNEYNSVLDFIKNI
jgi:thiol-disulfide isomerase/thioredoxin